ncbi:hypothetical protein T484DRAFT_1620978 [Baffinella frigidus]|nr:hypothetical protein T484DRAFT_1620978 [Cryptophyta sp. CCMP2293]
MGTEAFWVALGVEPQELRIDVTLVCGQSFRCASSRHTSSVLYTLEVRWDTPYSVLHTSYSVLHTPYSVLYTPCSVLYTPVVLCWDTPYSVLHTSYTPYSVHKLVCGQSFRSAPPSTPKSSD